MQQSPPFAARVHGCLLGGALGDALGYAALSSSAKQTGDGAVVDKVTGSISLPDPAPFSDETQLTLFAVDGLLEALRWANDGVPADEKACLWLAYLRWLRTQGASIAEAAPVPPPQWLDEQPVLHHRRGPDEACLTGLASGEMGTAARPVNPNAQGTGAVVRSAPFGLLPYVGAETAYRLSGDTALLTHGHPAARQSAAAFSWMINHIMHDGGTLASAAASAVERLRRERTPEPSVLQRLERALELGAGPALPAADITNELGTGGLAEEALAIGLYASLATESAAAAARLESGTQPQEHFRAGVVLAVDHAGKTDSTASITGNLLGALYGEDALPGDWMAVLGGQDLIRTMAASLVEVTSGE